MDGSHRNQHSRVPAKISGEKWRTGILLCYSFLLGTVAAATSTGDDGLPTPACPADGSSLPGVDLPDVEACVCKNSMEYWTGSACCVRNAHWNGTECECNHDHALEGGLCCHIDDHKGWDMDRCGCFNGSYWNGNSCLPGGVSCPPNALWNGTCYCKGANWASHTHPDVYVTGACCPKNAYYDWVVTGQAVNRISGQCRCLDDYPWNGTACVLRNVTASGWSRAKKAGVGAGAGVGAALLLAGGILLGILLYKARHQTGDKAKAPSPFKLPPKVSGLFNRSRSGPDKDEDTPHTWGSSQHPTPLPGGPDAASGTYVSSTALDLINDRQALSGVHGGLVEGEEATPEVVLVFVGPGAPGSGPQFDAHGSGPPIGFDGANAASWGHEGVPLTQEHNSGKTDSARTLHSTFTGSAANKNAGQTPAQGPPGVITRDGGGDPRGKDKKDGEEPHHDELWTRGVNPADVEILRDTRGQPVLLGRGAYAVVYLGRWQATLVAVKVMLASDSDAAQREVQAEADILRGLRHPNVVLLMAVCISPGQQMMVILEYCGGGNLHKALQKDAKSSERRLGWYRARSKEAGNGYTLAVDIARGLAYLHHRQLIHFDIKPANVLLDHAWSQAKISDVGLSKCVQGSVVSHTMRGTPAYMAPELISFEHPPSFAVDVYSFGVVLHHIITGEEPDQRKALRPLRVREECSSAVGALYENCLQDDPKLRPTAAEIVSILEKEF